MSEIEPNPDDELASAILDGEATPAEQARVEQDPALAERIADLDGARQRFGALAPIPAEARERSISAALAEFDQMQNDGGAEVIAFDEPARSPSAAAVDPEIEAQDDAPSPDRTTDRGGDQTGASPPVAPVVDLSSARRNRRALTVLGAAAAIVAAVAFVPRLIGQDRTATDATETAAIATEADSAKAASDDAADADMSGESAPSPAADTAAGSSADAEATDGEDTLAEEDTAEDAMADGDEAMAEDPAPSTSTMLADSDDGDSADRDGADGDNDAVEDADETAQSAVTSRAANLDQANDVLANPVDVGTHENAEDLARSATAVATGRTLNPGIDDDGRLTACLAQFRAAGSVVRSIQLATTGSIGERAVLGYLIEDDDGPPRFLTLDQNSCEVVDDRRL